MAEAFAIKKNVKFIGTVWRPMNMEQELTRILEISSSGLTFHNGDQYAGEAFLEDGIIWFIAIDAKGDKYETSEYPRLRIGKR